MKASSACQGELCNDKWHYISLGTIVKDYKDPRLNANDNWEDISQPNSALEELIGDEVSRLIRRGHIAVRYKTVARSSTIFFRIYIGASVAHGTKPLSSRTDAGKTTRTCWNLLLGSISRQLSDWYAGDGPNDDAAWPFSIVSRAFSDMLTLYIYLIPPHRMNETFQKSSRTLIPPPHDRPLLTKSKISIAT